MYLFYFICGIPLPHIIIDKIAGTRTLVRVAILPFLSKLPLPLWR